MRWRSPYNPTAYDDDWEDQPGQGAFYQWVLGADFGGLDSFCSEARPERRRPRSAVIILPKLTVEFIGSNDHGPCQCCGNLSRTVWGCLNAGPRTQAVYYVQWTLGRIDHGANFDLVLGEWGVERSAADRRVVAVRYRLMADGPQFMVIDAGSRPVAKSGELASTALRRDQVVGTPLAAEVFAMLDAIWLGDNRIQKLSGKVT